MMRRWIMMLWLGLGGWSAAAAENPCAVATPYPAGDWRVAYYEAVKAIDFSNWGKNVVFMGDSMMQLWNPHDQYPNGSRVIPDYEKRYPAVKVFYSLGVSGDQPQHTLWLINEGDILEKIPRPEVIVLMVGINSFLHNESAENVAGGVAAVVNALREKRPDAKILVMGIWPCWQRSAQWDEIAAANRRIAGLADQQSVFYLDFSGEFLRPDGELNGDLIRDGIHPSEAGYDKWAALLFPQLDSLIRNGTLVPENPTVTATKESQP